MFVAMGTFFTLIVVMVLVIIIVFLAIPLVLTAQALLQMNVLLVCRMQLYNPLILAHAVKDDLECLLYVIEYILKSFCL